MKPLLLRIHLWLGITVGLFWALQGLSGALLVFNRDIQATWLAPADAPMLPLDTLIARASDAVHAKVTRLETFGPNPHLLLAYHTTPEGERTAVVDGGTGAVLEMRDPAAMVPHGGGFWGWLLRWHESLLAGDNGLIVVGISGILLLTSLGMGLWTVWPARKRWRAAFRIEPWRRIGRSSTGVHRALGLSVFPALAAMIACGIYLAFAPQLRPVMASSVGYQMPYKAKPLALAPAARRNAQQAYDLAQTRFPGATMVRLVLPSAKSPVYLFRLLQPDDARRWAGTSTVAVDPSDGRIVNAYDSRVGPAANRITDGVYSVHVGDTAGVIGRMLVMLGGLALPALYLTGLWAWFASRSKRRRS